MDARPVRCTGRPGGEKVFYGPEPEGPAPGLTPVNLKRERPPISLTAVGCPCGHVWYVADNNEPGPCPVCERC
jgi:hypothetical protein